MNVLQHTRNELNLCLKQNQPDRSYRDTLLKGPCHDDIDVLGPVFRSIMLSYSLGPIYIAGGGEGGGEILAPKRS